MLFIRTIVSKKELRAGTSRKRNHLLYIILGKTSDKTIRNPSRFWNIILPKKFHSHFENCRDKIILIRHSSLIFIFVLIFQDFKKILRMICDSYYQLKCHEKSIFGQYFFWFDQVNYNPKRSPFVAVLRLCQRTLNKKSILLLGSMHELSGGGHSVGEDVHRP